MMVVPMLVPAQNRIEMNSLLDCKLVISVSMSDGHKCVDCCWEMINNIPHCTFIPYIIVIKTCDCPKLTYLRHLDNIKSQFKSSIIVSLGFS